jgi:hypothetical protein
MDGRLSFHFISLPGKPIAWPPTFELCLLGCWTLKLPDDSILFHCVLSCIKAGATFSIRCCCESSKSFFVVQRVSVKDELLFHLPPISLSLSSLIFPVSAWKKLLLAQSSLCRHIQ